MGMLMPIRWEDRMLHLVFYSSACVAGRSLMLYMYKLEYRFRLLFSLLRLFFIVYILLRGYFFF